MPATYTTRSGRAVHTVERFVPDMTGIRDDFKPEDYADYASDSSSDSDSRDNADKTTERAPKKKKTAVKWSKSELSEPNTYQTGDGFLADSDSEESLLSSSDGDFTADDASTGTESSSDVSDSDSDSEPDSESDNELSSKHTSPQSGSSVEELQELMHDQARFINPLNEAISKKRARPSAPVPRSASDSSSDSSSNSESESEAAPPPKARKRSPAGVLRVTNLSALQAAFAMPTAASVTTSNSPAAAAPAQQ